MSKRRIVWDKLLEALREAGGEPEFTLASGLFRDLQRSFLGMGIAGFNVLRPRLPTSMLNVVKRHFMLDDDHTRGDEHADESGSGGGGIEGEISAGEEDRDDTDDGIDGDKDIDDGIDRDKDIDDGIDGVDRNQDIDDGVDGIDGNSDIDDAIDANKDIADGNKGIEMALIMLEPPLIADPEESLKEDPEGLLKEDPEPPLKDR